MFSNRIMQKTRVEIKKLLKTPHSKTISLMTMFLQIKTNSDYD